MDATIIIDRVLKAVGLNAPTFAKTIGVNYQRIFDLQRGRVKKFHPEIVRKIIEKWPNMNANFIYTGEGEVMLKPGEPVPQPSIEDMVNGAVEKILDTEEFKSRLKLVDEREQILNKRENMLAEREAKVTSMYSELIERDKELREKEKKLVELERSIMTRELELEIKKNESQP
ncbi:MAG: hypothetical protein HXN85_04890 [Prevotella pallens]|jgi:hypothetical protein|uniref:hypothetical protein n=2 Tax=Prevotellaceae TaxID=171552 RepID=UPI001C5D947B|nr:MULTISPECIES: hypothetical protein [Prevotella]MBF1450903.1 hypothetical protein [Prevotella pallens]MBF1486975.1 hypothetical protein [Prevotella pallens]MBF1509297.1 hypothetical protein [Prevotella pallens]MBW4733860.1 hypothetical protein [Prevotella melaninogenica]MBW4736244.1 hypothetical protein [Prevotella melaninogenica]